MNKILSIYSGGFPHTQEDFTYLQNSVVKDFEHAVKMNLQDPNDNYILYGVEENSGSSTEGAIFRNGEIYTVEASSLASGVALDDHYIVYETKYDVNGNKLFKNGTYRDTYQLYEAYVTDTVPVTYEWAIRIGVLKRYQKFNFNTFITATFTDPNITGSLRYRIIADKMVELKGSISIPENVSVGSNVITVLDAGYRPDEQLSYSLIHNGTPGLSPEPNYMTINTNGTIQLQEVFRNDGLGTRTYRIDIIFTKE